MAGLLGAGTCRCQDVQDTTVLSMQRLSGDDERVTTKNTTAAGPRRPYHHGDLRRALLDAAASEIARIGIADLSLRALARATSVSHAAPTHHFGDKRGLLTALAVQGHRWLAGELEAVDGFLEVGVAYVDFAVAHPVHFEVMFRPDLLHRDDPELVLARTASRAVLQSGVAKISAGTEGSAQSSGSAALAAWSLAHGLATLRLTGNLPPTTDLAGLTRAALRQLVAGPPI